MNIVNTLTGQYPYTLIDLMRDNPNVSFPTDLVGVDLSDFNAAEVVLAPQPPYNEETHYLEPQGPDLIEDEWVLTWLVTPRVVYYSPDWNGFNSSMLADASFNAAITSVMETAPGVAISLPAALTQVASNGVSGFTLVYEAFCAAGPVTSTTRAAWAVLAETYHLPQDFIDVVRGDQNEE